MRKTYLSSSPEKIDVMYVNPSNRVISARMSTTDTLNSRMKLEKRKHLIKIFPVPVSVFGL